MELNTLNSRLNAAVRNRDKEAVLELLKQGADVNSKAESGWTPLHTAVRYDKDLVQLLLDRGASLHARKDNGGTAFTEAGIAGNVEILELLLERGSDINEQDINGFTAFMEAAWYGREEALRFLYSRGAEVNLRRKTSEEKAKLHKGGATALMDACREHHFSAVKILVQEMGADVNIHDNRDRNALVHALKKGSNTERYESAVSIVHFLLEQGVDVKSKDECGKTALILAVEMKSLELVAALLEKDEIDIDDADEEGNTALMVAVEKNDCKIAKLLCEKGARTDLGNLIEVAMRKRSLSMENLLREYNAKFVPEPPRDWEPNSKCWRAQLKKLDQMYRPMIGKLKTFPYIQQKIQDSIYLGLHGGTEVAVRIIRSAEGDKEKEFFEKCSHCEHLLKLFQSEKEKGCMYLCFPLWEKNLQEHLQDPEGQKDYKAALKMIFQALRELHSLGFAHQDLHPGNFVIDLSGKIYLVDFGNKRRSIEGQEELVNRFNFLKNVWNNIKEDRNRESIFQDPNVTKETFPYPEWTKLVDKYILRVMERGRKKYTDDVSELLRLMRNMDEHKQEGITKKIGDYGEYFLKVFPKLTIYVYNTLRQNPACSHFANFQDPSL
ncbi:ribonuclease L [Turdus rufiventris]|nr:ribonuclease L [Turdus rufiventris]